MAGAADIPAFRSMRTLRALRPLRAVSRWEGMRVSKVTRKMLKTKMLFVLQINESLWYIIQHVDVRAIPKTIFLQQNFSFKMFLKCDLMCTANICFTIISNKCFNFQRQTMFQRRKLSSVWIINNFGVNFKIEQWPFIYLMIPKQIDAAKISLFTPFLFLPNSSSCLVFARIKYSIRSPSSTSSPRS